MSDHFILVQRNTPGAAVSVRSTADKKILVVEENNANLVDVDQLTELLSSRQPFDPVAVPLDLADRVLGWNVGDVDSSS